MTVAVSISADVEMRLTAKAKSVGMELPTYVALMLQAVALRPPLDEILKPIRRKFASTGMTEEQASQLYEEQKHAARALERSTPFVE